MKTVPRLITAATFITVGALALAGCSSENTSGGAAEPDYPTRAVELVIPFGAGGATDIASRALADAMAEDLGSPFNGVNQPGANQITGVSAVLAAAADGYTLLADGAGSSTIQSLLTEIPYEWDDRTFIAKVATGSHAYAVSAKSGITTLDELAELAESDPSSFSVSWIGGTSTSDFATLQFLDAIGISPDDVTKVPFTGTGDAMQAAAAGDVDLAVGGSSSVASLYSSGDLVPLALTAADPNLPDVPLTADEGWEQLDMMYWVGLSGPADLPEGVVTALADSIEGLESDEGLAESFSNLGMTVNVVTGDELAGEISDETDLFQQLSDLGS